MKVFARKEQRPLSTLPINITVPRLTVLDFMRVHHATIREGESHCIWPAFVLHKFQTADVITEKKTKHYELRDANLRKVV